MHMISKPRLSAAVVLAASWVLVATGGANSAQVDPGGAQAGCRWGLKYMQRDAPTRLGLRIQCVGSTSTQGMRFDRLDMRPSKRIAAVAGAPGIVTNVPGTGLTCELGAGRLRAIHCTGRLVPPFIITVAFRLERSACSTPRLRLAAALAGGPDCQPGGVCPAGPAISTRVKRSSVALCG